MLPGITTMGARLRDSDARYLRQVKFNVNFDHGELFKVNSSRDVRVVNNLQHETLIKASRLAFHDLAAFIQDGSFLR
jgi:hypothetical protein